MDQFAIEHPVPQNITSFEFHLVGDMTLKQFAYLGVGLTSAYLVFVTLMSVNLFLAVPLIALFALSGVGFAFFPILDRPLDHWLLAFLKAVYSPTKGMWKLPGKKDLNFNEQWFKNRLRTYLSTLGPNIYPVPEVSRNIGASAPSTVKPQLTRISPVNPKDSGILKPNPEQPKQQASDELRNLVEMARNTQALQEKLSEMEKQINELKAAAILPVSQTPTFTKEVSQASEVLHDLAEQTKESHYKERPLTQFAPAQKPAVLIVPSLKQPKTQLLLTTFPNVINGVVADKQENYLEGVIVIIHNKDGLPVRALKTNKLGQFTGATPLPAGIYNVTFEKDGFEFETMQISLNNEVAPPIRVFPLQKEEK